MHAEVDKACGFDSGFLSTLKQNIPSIKRRRRSKPQAMPYRHTTIGKNQFSFEPNIKMIIILPKSFRSKQAQSAVLTIGVKKFWYK